MRANRSSLSLALLLYLVVSSIAPDPGGSWLAYAVFNAPDAGDTITHMSADFLVPPAPSDLGSGANPALWFGVQTAGGDGALVQPITAKWMGASSGYAAFHEIFDFTNHQDYASPEVSVVGGELVSASLSYRAADRSYGMELHSSRGKAVSFRYALNASQHANESVAYIVLEHEPARCAQLPGGGNATFSNVRLEVNGQPVASPAWATWAGPDCDQYKCCGSKATVLDPATVSIGWETQEEVAASKVAAEEAAEEVDEEVVAPSIAPGSAAPVTVFESSTGPYPCIRIPSMLALPDGSLLAFAECRRWNGDQCFVNGMENATRAEEFNRSICMRRSADGGATWSALQPNITQRYAANPSAVHDVSRSRTLLFFDDARSGGLYFMASADGGETWGAAVPLRNASGGALSGVSGPGNSVVAMTNGDLLSASYHADRNTSRPGWNSFSHAKVLRSSDGGESWHDVSPVDPLSGEQMFPHLGEPSLTLTPKGTLVFDSRCPDGRKPYPGPAAPCDCDCRGVSTSNDGGSTWGEMVYDPAVPDPDCQGSIVALANGSLAFSNANDPTYRVNPSVRLGRVVGAGAQAVEWDAAVTQLATTSTASGYSSIFQTGSGRLGVLWETQGQQAARGCRGEGCSIVVSFLD